MNAGTLITIWVASVLFGFFAVALVAFLLRGRPSDNEVEHRTESRLLRRFWRHYMMFVLEPWQKALVSGRISPNALTLGSLAVALGSAAAAATGNLGTAGWLYFAAGMLDILDGRVARATNRVSASGAFLDSVIDRYVEVSVFAGIAWLCRDTWAFFLVMAALLGSMMVSYSRARGESLGVDDVKVGVMQRPERIVVLGLSMVLAPVYEAFAGFVPPEANGVLIAGLATLALSTNLTAIRRIRVTMAALDARALALRPEQAPAPTAAAAPDAAPNWPPVHQGLIERAQVYAMVAMTVLSSGLLSPPRRRELREAPRTAKGGPH